LLLHRYSPKPATFTKKFLDFDFIYDLHIGIVLTEFELSAYSESKKFQKFFVFKELHEGHAHYFSSKFLAGEIRQGG